MMRTNLLALFLIFGLAVSAQNNYYENNYYFKQHRPRVTAGVKAGLNLSRFQGHPENMRSDIGFTGGIVIDYAFYSNLYMSTGIEFHNKRIKYDHEVHSIPAYNIVIPDAAVKAMYLQIPLHLGYKFNVTDMFRIAPHVGPYIAYGVGGRIEVGDYVQIEGQPEMITVNQFTQMFPGFRRVGQTFGDYGFEKFDYGLGVGLYFEYDKVGLGVNYDFGLRNVSKSNEKIKIRSGFITLGYKFN